MGKHLALPVDSGDLADPAWWRHVAERIGRQDLQMAVGVLTSSAANHDPFYWVGFAITLAGASAVALFKAVMGVTAKSTAPIWLQIVDRAGSAAAGVMVGAFAADNAWLNELHLGWRSVLWAAFTAAVTAVAMMFVTPPTQTETPDRGV